MKLLLIAIWFAGTSCLGVDANPRRLKPCQAKVTAHADANAVHEVTRLVRAQIRTYESTRNSDVVSTPFLLAKSSALASFRLSAEEIETIVTSTLPAIEVQSWCEARGIHYQPYVTASTPDHEDDTVSYVIDDTNDTVESPRIVDGKSNKAPRNGRTLAPKTVYSTDEVSKKGAEVAQMIDLQLDRYLALRAHFESIAPVPLTTDASAHDKALYDVEVWIFNETLFHEGELQLAREISKRQDTQQTIEVWLSNPLLPTTESTIAKKWGVTRLVVENALTQLDPERLKLWRRLNEQARKWKQADALDATTRDFIASMRREILNHRHQGNRSVRMRTNKEIVWEFFPAQCREQGEQTVISWAVSLAHRRMGPNDTSYRRHRLQSQNWIR